MHTCELGSKQPKLHVWSQDEVRTRDGVAVGLSANLLQVKLNGKPMLFGKHQLVNQLPFCTLVSRIK